MLFAQKKHYVRLIGLQGLICKIAVDLSLARYKINRRVRARVPAQVVADTGLYLGVVGSIPGRWFGVTPYLGYAHNVYTNYPLPLM